MTHAGAVSRRFRVQVSKYLTGGSHVCFFYSSRPIFPTFVVTISRFVLRPACLYPILQYIYVFFNTTFPPLDGNRCHSLNRPTAYRNPDPSLSLSLSLHIFVFIYQGYIFHLFTKLLFRGGSHLPQRAGAPHPARYAGDHDAFRLCDRDPGIQSHRFSPAQCKGLALYVRLDAAYARSGGPGVSAAIARKPEMTRL